MNTTFATDNEWAKICRWTLIHVCTMCTEKEDLLTMYFWVWREGLRQQLHLLHCIHLNGKNLWKQIFWTSGHPCCKESWQNGMKSRHSQETVIKCALEGRKVAPANTCRCVYMDAGELCGIPYTTILRVSIYSVWSPVYISLHVSYSLKSHLISSEAQGNIQTLWVLCLVHTHTHTLLLLLNLFYWIITDTQYYIFSGTLLSDSVFLYITPWSPWQV